MKITTIITFLLVALLLFGCTAQKAEEKEIAAETKSAFNETNIANRTIVSANTTSPETSTANTTSPEANASQNASARSIQVAYFYSLICPFCENATTHIEMLGKKYPISLQKYEIYYNETNFNLFKQYVAEYRLKPDEFAVPTVFINTSYYGGPNIYDGLENKIQNLTKETKK